MVWRWASVQATLCYKGTQLPLTERGNSPQFSAHFYAGQTGRCINWYGGMPRPHYARWGPSSSSPKRGQIPQFSAHVYCGQTSEWIKMPPGMEVGLGSGHIVLDEGHSPPLNFRPISVVAKWLDESRCYLVGGRP